MENPNAAAYRRTADAFRARDTEALTGRIGDEVVWNVPVPPVGGLDGDEHAGDGTTATSWSSLTVDGR